MQGMDAHNFHRQFITTARARSALLTPSYGRSILAETGQGPGIRARTVRAPLQMNEQETESLDLAALEARVDELIRTIDKLSNENRALKSQQATLSAERSLLIEKTEMARTRVESMIARLKAMETRQ